MIWKALVKSYDSFLRILDCPEVPSESVAISEQRNADYIEKANATQFITLFWLEKSVKIPS